MDAAGKGLLSLDAVSYSPSIVTMAVSSTISDIFSIKVQGCSSSLKMARIDRPYTTFY